MTPPHAYHTPERTRGGCMQPAAQPKPAKHTQRTAFTLIELSMVLVIIGLLVGSVLAGQSVISAAAVRSQVTQIEKFNQAANTFFIKYAYLPGDIPAAPAAQFGLTPRGAHPGQGDGNGLIQGNDGACCAGGTVINQGEPMLFWEDLSAANLIDGSFTTGLATSDQGSPITGAALNAYLPQAKIGGGNYIYVYSYNAAYTNASHIPNTVNLFGLSSNITLATPDYGHMSSSPGLTVQQAYSIDKKIDDGLPDRGKVLSVYLNTSSYANVPEWAAGGGVQGSTYNAATPGTTTTCYDNANVEYAPYAYSVEINSGSGVNCALTFQLQAGD